ncbi:hypothetical protein EV361DRAFT_909063 [Lentinula raphanica]|nr:hypothetical protein EV361DRAFT_909063 [Lentinula raphanica]
MKHVLGHSFRIGGAVELLLAGVPPHVVAAIGGWSSLAFLVYWRRIEDIILSQMSDAYENDWDRIRLAINNFQKENKISDSLITNCNQGLALSDL